jgi:L-lysine 2,3-aminomutase
VPLLNQSVLLAGVNDDAQVLAELSRRLFVCNVLPY